jgi:hypothetical protein
MPINATNTTSELRWSGVHFVPYSGSI